MKFYTVDPTRKQFMLVDVPKIEAAMAMVGLKVLEVDHGVVFRDHSGGPSLGIVVYQYSIAECPDTFMLYGRRFYGNAIVYGFDFEGVSIDVPDELPEIVWGS